MWWRISLALVAISLSGCTADCLRRKTANQADTTADVTYRQILQNLAMIADDPAALPSYSWIGAGTTGVTDQIGATGSLTISTTPVTGGLDVPGSRQVTENWAMSAVVSPEKLRAIRLACRYVIHPEWHQTQEANVSLEQYRCPVTDENGHPLLFADVPKGYYWQFHCDGVDLCADPPGYYYDVANELRDLQARGPCWLHVTDKHSIPKCAIYSATRGSVGIWVGKDGMDSLSGFTLVVQRIARGYAQNHYFPIQRTVTFKYNNGTKEYDFNVATDCLGRLGPFKSRLDDFQSDKKLSSAIAAGPRAGP